MRQFEYDTITTRKTRYGKAYSYQGIEYDKLVGILDVVGVKGWDFLGEVKGELIIKKIQDVASVEYDWIQERWRGNGYTYRNEEYDTIQEVFDIITDKGWQFVAEIDGQLIIKRYIA